MKFLKWYIYVVFIFGTGDYEPPKPEFNRCLRVYEAPSPYLLTTARKKIRPNKRIHGARLTFENNKTKLAPICGLIEIKERPHEEYTFDFDSPKPDYQFELHYERPYLGRAGVLQVERRVYR
jgi:hypothetical protein